MVFRFLERKTGLGMSVNEKLAENTHKPVIKHDSTSNLKAEMSMLDLKTIFRQQI